MSIPESATKQAIRERYPQSFKELELYVDILTDKGVRHGLLGPREPSRIWGRHIGNSLALADSLGSGMLVADVGSGAGLPGIPVALARPDLNLVLLEPLLRRANFLTEAVQELGIADRVQVLRIRAEDCDEVFDAVTCRAVAPLDRLLRWTTPLFFPNGELLALKGDSAEAEISDADRLLKQSGLTAEVRVVLAAPNCEPTKLLRVTKS